MNFTIRNTEMTPRFNCDKVENRLFLNSVPVITSTHSSIKNKLIHIKNILFDRNNHTLFIGFLFIKKLRLCVFVILSFSLILRFIKWIKYQLFFRVLIHGVL